MSVESRLSWLDAPGQFCRRRLTAMGGNLPLAKGSNRSFVDGLNRPVADAEGLCVNHLVMRQAFESGSS